MVEVVQLRPLVVRAATVGCETVELGLGRFETWHTTFVAFADALLAAIVDLEVHLVAAIRQEVLLLLMLQVLFAVARGAWAKWLPGE